jgi:hypothetical protein
MSDGRGVLEAWIGDGRPLLTLTALALLLSGGFALFLSGTSQFLPHDLAFLGASRDALETIAEGRLAYFMFHDRVAFGGSLIAIGFLYLWLAEFPLRDREAWAWWTFALSGGVGFASFLSYLGYGYLDTWHGAATLALLPVFVAGLWRTRRWLGGLPSPRASCRRRWTEPWRSTGGVGRLLLLATGAGMVLGGGTILVVGMTTIFVPQDLGYMRVTVADLAAANPRLLPLIAHDRAGFGGGICSCGLIVLSCVWCAAPSRSLWQALGLAGLAGFGAAIAVHFCVGYTSLSHLLPAYTGFSMYLVGLALAIRGASRGEA